MTARKEDSAITAPSASRQMIEIGRRMIANILADTTDLRGPTFVGDGSVFTDPNRFEVEREMLFRRTPQVIAWAGDLSEPGDIVARDVAGVPVVVTRHQDGELYAFLNACSHRGMTLCDGVKNRRRLTCPYHGWNYDLQGSVVPTTWAPVVKPLSDVPTSTRATMTKRTPDGERATRVP